MGLHKKGLPLSSCKVARGTQESRGEVKLRAPKKEIDRVGGESRAQEEGSLPLWGDCAGEARQVGKKAISSTAGNVSTRDRVTYSR